MKDIHLQPILAIPNTDEKREKLHKFLADNSIFTHYIYPDNLLGIPSLIMAMTDSMDRHKERAENNENIQ